MSKTNDSGTWVVYSMVISTIAIFLIFICSGAMVVDNPPRRSTVFIEGKAAYINGKTLKDNPYHIGTKVYGKNLSDDRRNSEEWKRGWYLEEERDN